MICIILLCLISINLCISVCAFIISLARANGRVSITTLFCFMFFCLIAPYLGEIICIIYLPMGVIERCVETFNGTLEDEDTI